MKKNLIRTLIALMMLAGSSSLTAESERDRFCNNPEAGLFIKKSICEKTHDTCLQCTTKHPDRCTAKQANEYRCWSPKVTV